MVLLSLWPGDLLPILKDGFRRSASSALLSSADATQAKGLLAFFTPVGLPPTEHVYLSWTHCLAKTTREPEFHACNTLRHPYVCC
jgi:hypothetical protein